MQEPQMRKSSAGIWRAFPSEIFQHDLAACGECVEVNAGGESGMRMRKCRNEAAV